METAARRADSLARLIRGVGVVNLLEVNNPILSFKVLCHSFSSSEH